ncbi:DUF4374 domain-containing protein [Cesiribacter andamanensis]|uniref:DUF4374 domain-containing protein n=1 Tax=Cesiribacter andamanensis AMV16 TaxID=1279009 RepID=M7NR61_9BACT|nr:DUF4374 domain-containing protein [Cesiribacter andamanensis]EMR00999.1 hypothetical protein ADICEAN_03881 [Cesiribacter andamanensis AMV16]
MFSINSVRQWVLPLLSLGAAAVLSSCQGTETPPTPADDAPYVLSLAVQGSDGGFTYYTVPFEQVMSGSLSAVGQGIEQPGYYDFTQIDNTIYSIGGLGAVDVVGISKTESGALRQLGNVSFANSLADIVQADANTLVALELSSNSDVVRLHTIDANSVTVTNTRQHPVSDLSSLQAPSYSGMRISGNQLFVSYYISDPTTYNTPYTDGAQVAVYSYPGLEFQKVIEDERTGPIGGFNTKSGLIVDERGDVYALSHSNPANGFSQTTKQGAILRIPAGQSEFDADYFLDVEALTGGKNIAHLKYLGNGKAFAEINTDANTDQQRWSDGPLRSAVLDLYNQTITYIDGLPVHGGSGRRLAALHDGNHLYMSIPEASGIYVYRIDLTTHTATKGAELEANFLAGFFKL